MKKLLSSTIAIGILATTSFVPAFAASIDAGALPEFNHGNGNVSVDKQGTDMNVHIGGGRGGVGEAWWDSFNVGKNGHVNFEFSEHNQTALNHVAQSGGMSNIFGRITSSSNCPGCNFEGTGKVILINPNGVLFGNGANVNLNSFTASAYDGVYDSKTNELQLDRNGRSGKIEVLEGAQIYGDKAINFAADEVNLYAGSKLSTNIGKNFNAGNGENADSIGKVKIVTADGVTFQYYDQGAVKELKDFKESNNRMFVGVNGEITSGNIDIRNYSVHDDSAISVKGAVLKAVKAKQGNDGNIWLTASNKVAVEDSNLTTVREAGAPATKANIRILSGKKVSLGGTNLDAAGDVKITSQTDDIVADGTNIKAGNAVDINAGNIASIQQKEKGKSSVTGKTVTVKGGQTWFNGATVKADNDIYAEATKGNIVSADSSMQTGDSGKITLKASNDVKGRLDVKNSQTNLYAGNDININLANVGVREKGLVAEAEKNVTISTDGTLSVSSLIAKNGDMTINADKVIAGLPYTKNEKIPGDNSERAYIYVANGKFTSNTKSDSYDVTASDTPINDGKDNLRHHIQYGNGQEKILLINPRPAQITPPSTDPVVSQVPSVNDDQASMLNKLPRQPESIQLNNNIQDGRTSFVDVFAAASQIEIVDDEEEK